MEANGTDKEGKILIFYHINRRQKMITNEQIQEAMNKLDTEETFDEFVNKWIEEHPDEVFGIIWRMLDTRIAKSWTNESEEWYKFLYEKAENELLDAMHSKEDILKSS